MSSFSVSDSDLKKTSSFYKDQTLGLAQLGLNGTELNVEPFVSIFLGKGKRVD
jgi:hypothetical protein